jgi:hypothetical protein
MDVPPVLLVVAIAVVVLAFAAYQYWAAEQRRQALAAFAAAEGLAFDRSPPRTMLQRFAAFDPFTTGHSRRAANLVHGGRGEIEWECFDYRYTTGSGKNQQTHRVGVAAARVDLAFPRLEVRPEGIFDKLAAAIGFDDIDFESAEFSRRYYVKSADRKFAYDLIHPQMMEYLLACPRRRWQAAGPMIVLTRSGYYAAEELGATMRMIEGFLERVPGFVRQDIGLRSA